MSNALKNDKKDRKPAMQFVHPDLMEGIGNAMGAGEIKYGDWNFLKGHGRLQLLSAVLRHTFALMRGEDVDKDTTELFGRNIYHWDCIGANINMLLWQREYGTLTEDRPPFYLPNLPAKDIDEDVSGLDETIEIGDEIVILPNAPHGMYSPHYDAGRVVVVVPREDESDLIIRLRAAGSTFSQVTDKEFVRLHRKKKDIK